MTPSNLTTEQSRVLSKGPFPDYPFTPCTYTQWNGLRQSYLDEGPRDGEVLIMLHGNPSWSYYWRKLVLGLRDKYRCIVPDHMGMGLSDKPDDKQYDYTLSSRVDDLKRLLDHLGIDGPVTLAVHDWGGMIGFGWAVRHMKQVQRLVILNTAAFPLPGSKSMPWQLTLGRNHGLGALAIRGANAFADGAARYGVVTPMLKAVKQAYVSPYDSWKNRIATLRFVQDIPLSVDDRAWSLVEASEKKLPQYADRPTFIGWGLKDFVFDGHFLDAFKQALPNAEGLEFDDAGHYVLEDKSAELVPAIRTFLDRHPIPPAQA